VRILLVDDAEDIRRIAHLSLEGLGRFPTALAASAAEALAMAASDPPDLIVMDVLMPDMDGPTALAALRRDPALRAIPVVFMTARAQPADEARYLALGAIGVIRKPFDPMTLPGELQRLVGPR
jgi:CheY-like chemotaxis protein